MPAEEQASFQSSIAFGCTRPPIKILSYQNVTVAMPRINTVPPAFDNLLKDI